MGILVDMTEKQEAVAQTRLDLLSTTALLKRSIIDKPIITRTTPPPLAPTSPPAADRGLATSSSSREQLQRPGQPAAPPAKASQVVPAAPIVLPASVSVSASTVANSKYVKSGNPAAPRNSSALSRCASSSTIHTAQTSDETHAPSAQHRQPEEYAVEVGRPTAHVGHAEVIHQHRYTHAVAPPAENMPGAGSRGEAAVHYHHLHPDATAPMIISPSPTYAFIAAQPSFPPPHSHPGHHPHSVPRAYHKESCKTMYVGGAAAAALPPAFMPPYPCLKENVPPRVVAVAAVTSHAPAPANGAGRAYRREETPHPPAMFHHHHHGSSGYLAHTAPAPAVAHYEELHYTREDSPPMHYHPRDIEDILRENHRLKEQLAQKDVTIAHLEDRAENLEKQITELRQLPTGKISHIPIEDMIRIMQEYGSEVSNQTLTKRKQEIQKASIVRQFRRWNPEFFRFFIHVNGEWVPKLGKEGELKRRAEKRIAIQASRKTASNSDLKSLDTTRSDTE